MKASTTIFTVSFLSAVGAGWYHLDAALDPDGPDRKPALTQVTLDGHQYTVGLDRDRAPAGEAVKLSLSAMAGVTGQVRVIVQEQSAMMDSRMEPPARTISSTRVDVGAEPATMSIDLMGALHADTADPLLTAGAVTRYTVLVTSDTDPNASAAIPVFAYEPEAYRLTVEAPTAGGVGEPCDVTVRVKNVSKKTLTGINIGLSSTFVSAQDTPVIESLDAGDEVSVTVHGTRYDAGQDAALLVQAFGYAGYGGTASAWATVDRDSGKIAARASEPYLVAYGS